MVVQCKHEARKLSGRVARDLDAVSAIHGKQIEDANSSLETPNIIGLVASVSGFSVHARR